ncbi:MAG: hypothetical protein AB7U51_04945 [Arcobacter sp.]|uniref:hypothetical protein n=1 Tax=Arcobacter sp. TaxID=1872629 RepID=UPI003D032470
MITQNELIDAIQSGIIDSHETYLKWSYDEWLWNAPEYLMTVKIAQKIDEIDKNKFITLEDNVEKILDIANAKGRGKLPTKIRSNGRFDIVVWWANGHPRAIIEVKNSVYKFANIEEDIIRICKTLNRKSADSKIQYGFIAFYICNAYKNNAKEKLFNKINKIYEQAKKLILEENLNIEKYIPENYPYSQDDMNSYSSVVLLIKR